MGECVRYHGAMCLPLQTIVSHGAGGVQRRLDVALLDDVLGAVGMIGPDPGEAVRLQLYRTEIALDRRSSLVARSACALCRMPSSFCT